MGALSGSRPMGQAPTGLDGSRFDPARIGANDPSDCESCDGFGCCWNNADPTSGQWVACEECGDTRGHP